MDLNDYLVKTFAKAVNNTTEKETKLYYGTITRVETVGDSRIPYVHLDGSDPDSETPLVEGTEVMVDDRVIVTIENHKAIVMSNITSPASARTAKNYMDLSEEDEGLVIGALNDENNNYNVLIKADGVYVRDGDDVLAVYGGDGTVLYVDGERAAEFTPEGIQFFTELANYAHIGADGQIDNATISYLHVDDLDTNYANITSLNAATARIGTLEADNATINGTLTAHAASIGTLEADNATINGTLTAHAASIGTLEAADATINGTLTAHAASIGTLEADTATINGELTAQSARIGSIESTYVDTDTLEANYAHITDGVIDNATIGYADVDGLYAHYATIDIANVNNAWIENGVIKNAAITNEQVLSVSANKLTAGTIDASEINVANLRAKNLIVEKMNGQPILGGYELVSKNSTGYSSKNPSNEGWYEYQNGSFIASTDTTVNQNKAYYKDGNQVALYDQTYIDGLETNLNQRIDGAVETFTGTTVPTLVNYPAVDWTSAQMASHIGDIYYVVNTASNENGYCYRFAYDNATSSYKWILIKDSDVTKALSDIDDLQDFQSDTESWIIETDEGLETIRSNHTTLSGVVNKTVKSSTQLWFTKANSTAPSAPTSEVTSTSTSGNGWRTVVPTYSSTYPYYFYCWQYKFVDNTFGWSAVIYDQATTEAEERARTGVANAATADGKAVTAQNTANANIKNTIQLWKTTNSSTTLSKPYTDGSTNYINSTSTNGNTWTTVVPTYNASYPYYHYCYQQQRGDGKYQWSTPVYDQATSEAMKRSAEFVTFQSTTFKDVKDTVDEHSTTFTTLTEQVNSKADSSTVTTLSNTVNSVSQTATSNSSTLSQLTTTLGTNADGTTKTDDIMHRMSSQEQDLDGFKTTVSSTYQTKSDMSNYSTTTQMNSAINQKANEITTSVSQTYATQSSIPTKVSDLTNDSNFATQGYADGKASDAQAAAIADANKKLAGQFAISTTDGGAKDKVATITPAVTGWTLYTGASITVKFTTANTATTPTLNVNSTGAKTIKAYTGTAALSADEYKWPAGATMSFVYDGTYWRIQDSTELIRLSSNESSITQTANSIVSLVANTDTYTKPDGTTATNTIKSAIKQNADNIALRVEKSGVISAINLTSETAKIQASKVEIDGTAVFNSISSDVEDAITDKGYQTSSQVEAAITSKGYQTASDVSNAISNKADKTAAVTKTQRIYYRSNSSNKPTGYPTAWVTESGDKWNDNNTTTTGWSLKKTPIANGTGASTTKYLYLWCATQRQTADGTVQELVASDIALDDSTTVIDGGKIITGSVTASQLATDAIQSLNYTAPTTATTPYSVDGTLLDLSNGNITTPNFVLDSVNGNAYLNGHIETESGHIGGFTITDDSIYHNMSSTSQIDLTGNSNIQNTEPYVLDENDYLNGGYASQYGVFVGLDGISCGFGKFSVDSDGALHSTSGDIGGWEINADSLSRTDVPSGAISQSVSLDNDGLDFNATYSAYTTDTTYTAYGMHSINRFTQDQTSSSVDVSPGRINLTLYDDNDDPTSVTNIDEGSIELFKDGTSYIMLTSTDMISFRSQANEDRGIYDDTYYEWILWKSANNNVLLNGNSLCFLLNGTNLIHLVTDSTDGNLKFRPATDSLNGDIYLGSPTRAWYCGWFKVAPQTTSDLKVKSVIKDFDWNVDKFIYGLKPIAFKRIKEDGSISKRVSLGFGAQDVAKLAKDLDIGDLNLYSATIIDENEDGEIVEKDYHGEEIDDSKLSWGLRYEEFIAPMVLEIQRLMDRVDALEAELAELKNK